MSRHQIRRLTGQHLPRCSKCRERAPFAVFGWLRGDPAHATESANPLCEEHARAYSRIKGIPMPGEQPDLGMDGGAG